MPCAIVPSLDCTQLARVAPLQKLQIVETRVDDGTYPHLLEAKGKAPRQYHAYEDADDEDET